MWWYVYFLKSMNNNNIYIGSTNNLRRRLSEHNKGFNKATKPFIPWKVDSFIAVRSESKARELEKYFKTGSGTAIFEKRIFNLKSEKGTNL